MFKYEINETTLAILPFSENKSRVIEKEDEYIVNDTPTEVMEHSCEYFGSSLEGRMLGSKNMIGSVYKPPIIVEDTKKLIFFPTQALASEKVGWISYKNIKNIEKNNKKTKITFKNGEKVLVNIPYYSIKNQMFRCNVLEAEAEHRRLDKKND